MTDSVGTVDTAGPAGKGWMCGLFRRRASPPDPDHGKVMVDALHRMVSYTVQPRTSKTLNDSQTESQFKPTLLRNPSQFSTKSDKRVRIRWNVDPEEVNEKLGEHGGALDDTNDGASTRGDRTPRHSRPSFHTLDGIDFAVESVSHPAYEEGQRIEYFSVTHQLWMSGIISTEVFLEEGNNGQCHVLYNVTLTNGQFREGVGLDVLRTPFQQGEFVELVTGQRSELRLAAAIAADQSSAPSMLGYRVVLQGTMQNFSRITPLRLKRRFPRGRIIEVYRGPKIGWQMAKVHHTASRDGCEAELLLFSEPSAPAPVPVDATSSRRASGPSNEEFGVWTSVPICELSLKEGLAPEYVPSYLLRLNSRILI